MLVKVLSDLHLHPTHNSHTYVDHGEYVCILAGDIAEGMRGVNWAVSNIPKHIQVLYVPGNHEYYGQEYFELNEKFSKHNMTGSNVQVLLNEEVEIGGITFAGSTLWTDFALYGDSVIAGNNWKRGLNDHSWIKYRDHNLSILDMLRMNKEALSFLSGCSAKVLVTHYGPSTSESPRWAGHPLTPGFLTKIPRNIHSRFKYHIHGHTHSHFDYTNEHGVRIICNPKGYFGEGTSFNDELVIDIT